ncbi:hypothetical protein ACFQV8_08255 [Pseudonocardia benzenivorans]
MQVLRFPCGAGEQIGQLVDVPAARAVGGRDVRADPRVDGARLEPAPDDPGGGELGGELGEVRRCTRWPRAASARRPGTSGNTWPAAGGV